jgi:hypothetical protein
MITHYYGDNIGRLKARSYCSTLTQRLNNDTKTFNEYTGQQSQDSNWIPLKYKSFVTTINYLLGKCGYKPRSHALNCYPKEGN